KNVQCLHTTSVRKQACGSYLAVSHLPSVTPKIRDNSSPLKDLGGVAALHSSDTFLGSNTHFCGASLISERYLLTAAHCIVDSERPIRISLGREDLDKDTSPGVNTYEVEDFIVHPGFRSARNNYDDIALIRTTRRVQYGPMVWPFCLPQKNQVLNDFFPVQIAGYGQVSTSEKSSSLRTAYVDFYSNQRCENEWILEASDNYDLVRTYDYPSGLTEQILCAGKEGVDACR
ncbi:unnamed protein product, partial [Meganyctiphanes norvegica]